MRVKACSKEGKTYTNQDRYRHICIGEKIRVAEEKTLWARKIFE